MGENEIETQGCNGVGFTALSGPSSQDELAGVPEKFLLICIRDEV
jgi:hypothetical protein